MKRRTFIAGLGSAAAWPAVARAQQPAVPVVGFLNPGSPTTGSGAEPFIDAFIDGLRDAGYVDGRNVRVETRWVGGQYERLPAMVADLMGRRVAAIFAIGLECVRAAKMQTASIPIVFSIGEDPVKEGFVASLSRPGSNITGFANFMNLLGSK